ASRLAHPEEEADRYQRPESPGPSRRRREEGPPEHHSYERPARPIPVAQPPSGHFEQRVRDREGAEDPADRVIVLRADEAERGADVRHGPRDADAVDVLNDGERDAEIEHAESHARRDNLVGVARAPHSRRRAASRLRTGSRRTGTRPSACP